MQPFCESIGTLCSQVIVPQKIISEEYLGVGKEDVKAFKIEWLSSDHFVYLIPRKMIAKRDFGDLQKSMFSMYERQLLCDFSLIAKDNSSLKVHSIPLFTYGGEVVQKMLTANMKESTEKIIRLSEYSLNTVKAFVDFIYLGEKGLEPESILKKSVDLCELIDMAHVYRVQPLVDCCTNLLSLFSSIDDIEKIEYLAKHYENVHLKDLHTHLLTKFITSQLGSIKV